MLLRKITILYDMSYNDMDISAIGLIFATNDRLIN